MKKTTLVVIIVLSALFVTYNIRIFTRFQPTEKGRIVHEMESKVMKKLRQEMGLIPYGFGSQMMDQIEMLSLLFQYNQPIDLQEGRRLLVKVTVEYIKEINSNEKVRQYLCKYPFQNVEIVIFLKKPDGSDVDQGDFEVLCAKEGKLQFKILDRTTFSYETYEETFEEAYRIVKEEAKKQLMTSLYFNTRKSPLTEIAHDVYSEG